MKLLVLESCVARVEVLFQLSFSSYMFCLWKQAYECVCNGSSIISNEGQTFSSPSGFGVSSNGSDLPLPPRTVVEAFMAAQKGMLCQILQTQQQLVQMLQQQPPLGAYPNGPNLVTQTTNSTRKYLEKPQPFESCSPRVPTQGDKWCNRDVEKTKFSVKSYCGQYPPGSLSWVISN
jgi:hypothetical protein